MTPFLLATKWLDKELAGTSVAGAVGNTGLLYYGHRYLSTRLGRWLNEDPIGEKGGLNLYTLVANNAVNTTDLLGLFECERVIAVRQSAKLPVPNGSFVWLTNWQLLAAWPTDTIDGSGSSVQGALAVEVVAIWLRQYTELCKCCVPNIGVVLRYSVPNYAAIEKHIKLNAADSITVYHVTMTFSLPIAGGLAEIPVFTWTSRSRSNGPGERSRVQAIVNGDVPPNNASVGIRWQSPFAGPPGMTKLVSNLGVPSTAAPFPGTTAPPTPAASPWPAGMPTIR